MSFTTAQETFFTKKVVIKISLLIFLLKLNISLANFQMNYFFQLIILNYNHKLNLKAKQEKNC